MEPLRSSCRTRRCTHSPNGAGCALAVDVPAEQRLADLENTLRLIGLDPAEYAPLLAPLVDIPLPAGTRGEIRAGRTAATATRRDDGLVSGGGAVAASSCSPSRTCTGPTRRRSTSLRALAERGAQAPLLIVGDDTARVSPALEPCAHTTALISLAPLDRAEVRRMVGEIAASMRCPTRLIEGVSERTGGVPLFVEEVTRLLARARRAGRCAGDPADLAAVARRAPRSARARRVRSRRSARFLDAISSMRCCAMSPRPDEPALQASLDRLADADLLFVEGAPPRPTIASSTR